VTADDAPDPTVARLLDAPAVWADVTPGLRDRTLEATAGVPTRHELPTRPDRIRGDLPRRMLLAAAAVAVLGLMVAGGLQWLRGDDAGGVTVALAGTDAAPGATATAELRDEPAGMSVVLDVQDLAPAPAGSFYEVWLVDGTGTRGKVSAGTFHMRGDQDRITLWLGVDPEGYDAVTVTRQPAAGGTTADGVVVLRGPLPPGGDRSRTP
jgi:hypothetical protein